MNKPYLLLILFALTISSFQAQMTPTYNDILIPMRDGKFLSADVFIPDGTIEGEVILIQTPYNKNMLSFGLPLGIGMNVDEQPYIFVVVDWRGFYGSAAAVTSDMNRGEDGFDVCEWIVAQSWHKDRIGTWGPSALGKIQYDLAFEHHPNHTCAVPIVAHPHFSYDDYFYGGVLEEARLEQLDALGYGLSPVIMANVYYSNTWAFAENTSWTPEEIAIPTLQIGGWYDHNIDKMMDWYAACRAESTLPDEQFLLVGPWVHGGTGAANVGTAAQGELTYPNAAMTNNEMSRDFFNYYLLDSVNNWQNTDKITYYETGKDSWNSSNASTIEALTEDIIYLNSGAQLTALTGTGSSTFISNPTSPAPTIGGANLHPDLDQGPYDQISLESRTDIKTFQTNVLAADASISGRVVCDLFIEADQADCDIMVHLVDVYPDGRNMLITDGARRMRFRSGYTAALEEFMTPGTVYNVEVELPFTNYTWKAGHRIKIYIGGNSSIRWNVNLQNGGPMYTAGTANTANITVHHSSTYPSNIHLPGDNNFLSLSEEDSEQFFLFPNPTKESLTIQSVSVLEAYQVSDITGRILLKGNTPTPTIDVSSLHRGVYSVQFSVNGKFVEQRFVKD